MILIKASEIYFIIPHYEDLNGLQRLIPNLLSHGAKKIGIFDGPFETFKGGTGEEISADGSIGYLNTIKEVEVFKMGRCWMEAKLTKAFSRAEKLDFKYAMILGCDEWLEGDFDKFGISTDKYNVASMPFRENHVDEMYNRNVVLMHRFFINPGQLEGRVSHYEYFIKGTKERIKASTHTTGTIEIHHDDRVRNNKRNKEMEQYQLVNQQRENTKRAKHYDDLKRLKFYIGIPNTGSINAELVTWLLNMQFGLSKIPGYEGAGIDLHIARPVDNNRNIIAKRFLLSDCTHLLFIDSDIIPDYQTIEKLLIANKDIIGPKMPIWLGPESGLAYPALGFGDDAKKLIDGQGPKKISFIGTGCLLIKRKVLEKMPKPFFKFITDEDGIVIEPEDNYFCKNAIRAGFEIWVHQDIEVKHFRIIELSEIAKNNLNNSGVKVHKI